MGNREEERVVVTNLAVVSLRETLFHVVVPDGGGEGVFGKNRDGGSGGWWAGCEIERQEVQLYWRHAFWRNCVSSVTSLIACQSCVSRLFLEVNDVVTRHLYTT